MSMGRSVKKRAASASLLLLLLLGTVASGSGYFGRLARAQPGAQKKLSGKPLAAARALYTQNCARCHGADGRAQSTMGRAFGATDFTDVAWWDRERPSDRRLTNSIREGRGDMPPFGSDFTKKEIAALVQLVRAFNGK